MSCTAGIEINATTNNAMPIKAAMLNKRMRVRMRGSVAAASKSATVTAAEIAKCAHAPREKLRKRPPIRKVTIASPVSRSPRVMKSINSSSSGKIRNGPYTFGSLKVALTRSLARKMSEPGSRWKNPT
jgi:hypothetical protein